MARWVCARQRDALLNKRWNCWDWTWSYGNYMFNWSVANKQVKLEFFWTEECRDFETLMDWHKLERLIKVKAVLRPQNGQTCCKYWPTFNSWTRFIRTYCSRYIMITKGSGKIRFKQVVGLKVVNFYIASRKKLCMND